MRGEESADNTYKPTMSPINYIEVYLASINASDNEELKNTMLNRCARNLLIDPWTLDGEAFRERFGQPEDPKMRCLFDYTL